MNQRHEDQVSVTDLHVEATYRLTEALIESENRMRRRIELLAEVIFETDEQGIIVFLNQAWERLLGFPTRQCVGRALADFIYYEDQPLLADLLANCKQQTQGERPQMRAMRKSGELSWFEISMARIPAGGVVGVFYDVTRQKIAQDEIAMLSVVASSTDNMVIITDGSGQIEWGRRSAALLKSTKHGVRTWGMSRF